MSPVFSTTSHAPSIGGHKPCTVPITLALSRNPSVKSVNFLDEHPYLLDTKDDGAIWTRRPSPRPLSVVSSRGIPREKGHGVPQVSPGRTTMASGPGASPRGTRDYYSYCTGTRHGQDGRSDKASRCKRKATSIRERAHSVLDWVRHPRGYGKEKESYDIAQRKLEKDWWDKEISKRFGDSREGIQSNDQVPTVQDLIDWGLDPYPKRGRLQKKRGHGDDIFTSLRTHYSKARGHFGDWTATIGRKLGLQSTHRPPRSPLIRPKSNVRSPSMQSIPREHSDSRIASSGHHGSSHKSHDPSSRSIQPIPPVLLKEVGMEPSDLAQSSISSASDATESHKRRLPVTSIFASPPNSPAPCPGDTTRESELVRPHDWSAVLNGTTQSHSSRSGTPGDSRLTDCGSVGGLSGSTAVHSPTSPTASDIISLWAHKSNASLDVGPRGLASNTSLKRRFPNAVLPPLFDRDGHSPPSSLTHSQISARRLRGGDNTVLKPVGLRLTRELERKTPKVGNSSLTTQSYMPTSQPDPNITIDSVLAAIAKNAHVAPRQPAPRSLDRRPPCVDSRSPQVPRAGPTLDTQQAGHSTGGLSKRYSFELSSSPWPDQYHQPRDPAFSYHTSAALSGRRKRLYSPPPRPNILARTTRVSIGSNLSGSTFHGSATGSNTGGSIAEPSDQYPPPESLPDVPSIRRARAVLRKLSPSFESRNRPSSNFSPLQWSSKGESLLQDWNRTYEQEGVMV